MTSQSIYTEYANLSPENIQWLDGCGAVWAIGDKFSMISESLLRELTKAHNYIWFNHPIHRKEFSWGSAETKHTHIPTGSEFCERVAEILGIEKPMFASDLKDKLVKKLEMHDRMERPLPEVEDEKGTWLNKLLEFLASRPTCGVEQRKFLDEVEKLNANQVERIYETICFGSDLSKVINGE